MRLILNITALLAALAASGAAAPSPSAAALPGAPPEAAERARYLMGTLCRAAVAHEDGARAARLAESALDEIARWESILSDWRDDSELSRLNAGAAAGPFRCSPDLFAFLTRAAALARDTAGAFDITVGPLVDLYDIRGRGRWPDPPSLDAARAAVGRERLRLDPANRSASFDRRGARLDPGAVGKGWALDAAGEVLRAGGARWGLLDFGGQILAVGGGPDGAGFPVVIAPRGRTLPPGPTLRLRDASASTTGDDERGLVLDGRPLSHVIDPRSGWPASRCLSATVVARSATDADALSTAVFVLGPEDGLLLAARLGAEAYITPAGDAAERPVATPGLARLLDPAPAGDAPASPALTRSRRGSR